MVGWVKDKRYLSMPVSLKKSVSTFRGELCHLKVSITKMATEIRVIPLSLLKISMASPCLPGEVQKS